MDDDFETKSSMMAASEHGRKSRPYSYLKEKDPESLIRGK